VSGIRRREVVELDANVVATIAALAKIGLDRVYAMGNTVTSDVRATVADLVALALEQSSANGSAAGVCGTGSEHPFGMLRGMTTTEIARATGRSTGLVRRVCRDGELHSHARRTPHGWVVDADAAEAWIEARR